MSGDPVDLSERFLLGVRRSEQIEKRAGALADLDDDRLAALGDPGRIAFWVNVYNGAAQRALDRDPEQYRHRRQFFAADLVTVAGRPLSLDDIEHGILRRSYHKLTLGYLRTPAPLRPAFHDRHAPDRRDPRIHFALNCGAESCPPIAAYTREAVEDQLDWATEGYLETDVEYDAAAGTVTVPRVMLWFRGDFGGNRGVYDFLRRYDRIPESATPSLSYDDWDWSLDAGAFVDSDDTPRQ